MSKFKELETEMNLSLTYSTPINLGVLKNTISKLLSLCEELNQSYEGLIQLYEGLSEKLETLQNDHENLDDYVGRCARSD